jgi:predicted alpha/beta hydrolase family esterase
MRLLESALPDMDSPKTTLPKVLLLPGWQGSGKNHWQTIWQRRFGDTLVEQADWSWPRRGDWMSRLDDVVSQGSDALVLAAHSLGCQLIASWASHSKHASQVACAMLVAPPDTERDDMPPQLFNWRPISLAALPFPSTIVVSTDDPYCSVERSALFCTAWQSEPVVVGPCGHINAESALDDWPEGRQILTRTYKRATEA